MFYQNTFPKFLEAICIGPNPDFLEKNTSFCDYLSAFPQEVELMYDWKSVKRSSNPMNALRNFAKKFIVYGPDLDVQTLTFFVKKVKNFPEYYTETILREVGDAFDAAKEIPNPTDIPPTQQNNTPIQGSFINNNTSIHQDNSFLNKLAQLLASCKSPCNYFKPTSSSIGTLADFGRALSDSASMLAIAGDDLLHAPVNISTGIVNRIKPAVRTEFFKLKTATQELYRSGVKPFFTQSDKDKVKASISDGGSPDKNYNRLPLTGDTDTYYHVSQSHSKIQSKIKENLGDCYRTFEHGQRFNPYDPAMNAAYAKRKYMGVKNGNVSSLVDITGSAAPASYVTETTYENSLDSVNNQEYKTYEDGKKASQYNTYDGPSKGAEAVVTAGGSKSINPAQAAGAIPQADAGAPVQAGAGLENVPNTGKVYEYGFGEVKITAYGYMMDECPDTGSEMGIGHMDNMIIPLKTIAVSPESIKQGLVKSGDVLIITVTDKKGNTWTERRQVGDTSGAGLQDGKIKYKFLIDEFLPTKKGSKMANRASELKLTIRIADTKEAKAKWNVQEASTCAPMFLSRNDWERAKSQGLKKEDGTLMKNIALKMKSGEYNQYIKWNENETLYPSFVNHGGCTASTKAWTKPKA